MLDKSEFPPLPNPPQRGAFGDAGPVAVEGGDALVGVEAGAVVQVDEPAQPPVPGEALPGPMVKLPDLPAAYAQIDIFYSLAL